MRDVTLEETFHSGFTTRSFTTGEPTTLAGTPVLSVKEGTNDTFITAGVSIDVDTGLTPVPGLHEATVVATAANGYEATKSYALFISTGTVGGVNVAGEVIERFTVQASAAAVALANGVSLGEILGTALTESSAGRIAGNWRTFYDNADAASTKVQDDIGGAVFLGPQLFKAISSSLVGGTGTSGDVTSTEIRDGVTWDVNVDNAGTYDQRLEFNIGAGIAATAFDMDVGLAAGGMRAVAVKVEDKSNPGTFVLLFEQIDSGGLPVNHATTLLAQYTDANGDLTIQLVSSVNALGIGDDVSIDFAAMTASVEGGDVPSAVDIAIAVDVLQSATHGVGNWEGSIILETFIASVTSQTVFTLTTGPVTDDIINGLFIVVTNPTDEADVGLITDYAGGTTFTVTMLRPMVFTIAVGDAVKVIFRAPVTVAGIETAQGITAYTETTPGNLAGSFSKTFDVTPASMPAGTDLALEASVQTLLGRITSTLFANMTSLAQWLGQMAGKHPVDATAQAEIRATGIGGGSYDGTADSLEATSGNLANVAADVVTLLGRITVTLFANMTSLGEWLGLIAGKQVGDATARSELQATGVGSGTYDEVFASQEATRDDLPDIVWDELLTGATHNINNSAGKRLRDIAGLIFDEGTLQSATTTTVTLALTAPSGTNFLKYRKFITTGGLGANQEALIVEYNLAGDTKIASLHPALSASVNGTTEYIVTPGSSFSVAQNGSHGGKIYLDTVGGTSGLTPHVNGIDTLPTLTLAEARTIADSINVNTLSFTSGSSVQLAQSFEGFILEANISTIDVFGQNVDRATFHRAIIFGSDSGTFVLGTLYDNCQILTYTVSESLMQRCQIGAVTLGGVGSVDYTWTDCFDFADPSPASAGFQATAVTRNLNLPGFNGRIEVRNFNAGGGTHGMRITGKGELIIAASCAGGSITLSGEIAVTDNADGRVTLIDDARYAVQQINAEVLDVMNVDTYPEPGQLAPPATASIFTKLNHMYKRWRNQADNIGATTRYYADDKTTVDQKQTTSESAGTVTVGEIESGP